MAPQLKVCISVSAVAMEGPLTPPPTIVEHVSRCSSQESIYGQWNGV